MGLNCDCGCFQTDITVTINCSWQWERERIQLGILKTLKGQTLLLQPKPRIDIGRWWVFQHVHRKDTMHFHKPKGTAVDQRPSNRKSGTCSFFLAISLFSQRKRPFVKWLDKMWWLGVTFLNLRANLEEYHLNIKVLYVSDCQWLLKSSSLHFQNWRTGSHGACHAACHIHGWSRVLFLWTILV